MGQSKDVAMRLFPTFFSSINISIPIKINKYLHISPLGIKLKTSL